MTIADVPAVMLKVELNLTSDQEAKIAAIQKAARAEQRKLMPGRPPRGDGPDGPPPGGGDPQGGPPVGGPPEGGPPPGDPQGGPPSREEMRATMAKMDALGKATAAKIDAELTSDQRSQEPRVVANADGLRHAGIPLELYSKLSLSSEQEQKLVSIGDKMKSAMDSSQRGGDPGQDREAMMKLHDETRAAVDGVLTAEQKKTMDDFMKSHQRGRGGRPGGGGGF